MMSPACLQSIGLPLAMSIGNLLDFHWFGCGFAVSPLEVHWKSLLDFVVQPKMPRQAPENHRKNTGVKQQIKINSAYAQSDRVRLEKQWECKDLYHDQVKQWKEVPPNLRKTFLDAGCTSTGHWSCFAKGNPLK